MNPKLTHSEACRLVEKCLERISNTIAYIRQKLDKNRPPTLFDLNAVDEANLLCNINYYGAYLKGIKTAIVALERYGLLDIPKPKGWQKEKDDKIYNKAIIELIMRDSVSMDRFLGHDYDNIRFADHERDKKGRLVKCRAYFAKRVTKYEEI